jgi:Bcr/CflA subfamily drug resistance transporter
MQIFTKVSTWMLLSLFSLTYVSEAAYNASLPNITDCFDVSIFITQTLSFMYFIGFTLGILVLGRLSDIVGRRRIIICGIFLYSISYFIAVFITNINILMILRFSAAFGASVGSVVAQAMARDSYKQRALSLIYASSAIYLALLPSLGSIIAGYIIEYSNYHYVFACLSFASAILLILYIKYLPETNQYIGLVANNSYYLVLKTMLKDKILLLYAFIIGSFNGIAFGFFIEAPFIFINKLKMTPSKYGILVLLLGASMALGSFVNKYCLLRFVSNKKIMNLGLALSFTGCILFVIISYIIQGMTDKYLIIAMILIPMMLHMIGHGISIPIALRYALEDYAKVTGTAGSIFGGLYYFIIAMINLLVAKLHNDDFITSFALLFFILSACCNISFFLIQKYSLHRPKYNFH